MLLMTISEVRNQPLREKLQILKAIWDDLHSCFRKI